MSSSKPGHEFRDVLAAASRYASTRVRSRQELQQYLKRRGVPAGTARQAVAACAARGLLDDRACARLWAEHWARRGYAGAAIYQRLMEKALDAAAIEQAIRTITRDSDDEARAQAFIARHLDRRTVRPSRSRLARTLASRGFDPDVIERVLCEAVEFPSSS